MKLTNFWHQQQIHLGICLQDGLIDATSVFDLNMEDCFSDWPLIREKLHTNGDIPLLSYDQIRFAPLTKPGKIIGVGLNYRDHAEETKGEPPKFPLLFGKFNDALAAHNQDIILPSHLHAFDYEAELVIIIGKQGSEIKEEDAADYIFGFSCGNDFSARDSQFVSSQWLIGKTFAGFAPVGPCIATADQLSAGNLNIVCRRNGQTVQSSNTKQLIFTPAQLVSYASYYMQLNAGDMIFSGTPGGVILGYAKDKRQWLKAGELIEVEIEGIGVLSNRLVTANK